MKMFFQAILTLICLFAFIEEPIIANEKIFLSEQIEAEEDEPILQLEIIKEQESISKGEAFSLILKFTIEDNWHLYWKNPGDSGFAPLIEWQLPEGFKLISTQWQTPDRFDQDSLIGFGYEKELLLLVDLEAPANLNEKKDIPIKASVNWLACSDSNCLPGNSEILIHLKQDEKLNSDSKKINPYFEAVRNNFPKKTFQIEARENKEGIINLAVFLPDNQRIHYTGGYFCPEDKDFIDHKNLLKVENLETGFNVKLNKQDNPNQNRVLNGILVLFHEKGKDSIAIHSPLQKEGLIASLDPLEMNQLEKSKLSLEESESEKSEHEGKFLIALFFSFIGGMLLNLMPCVLPVLSLKILSFVKMAGESRSLKIKHGLAFSFGVLLSFWVLAAALLTLQAYGKAVGWGFQLQEPIFVAFLASIIFILGLNLFGIMEMGTRITSLAGNVKVKKEGLASSFFGGILATAIATPCTGPFLGSAVGYAVTLPPLMALLIFTFLGAGMAFPYLLFSAYPQFLSFIPKPGKWMVTFKEIMGFIMMMTTLWLLWVFSAETSNLSLIFLLGALLSFGIGCWIYGKWSSPLAKKSKRKASQLGALFFMLVGIFIILEATKPYMADEIKTEKQQLASNWEPFSIERIKELQAKGVPVFVDFTAKWCLICQTNHLALTTSHAEEHFKAKGVVRMKADWTKSDPIITKELKKFGRNSVPLYVLYGTNTKEKPKILPQVLTSDIVVNYLHELDSPLKTSSDES